MVYPATDHHDMRKSINALALVVADTLNLDPVSPRWFVFCNRGRDRLKILHWDTEGFWLHCRRFEQGRFRWLGEVGDVQTLAVTARQLRWLIYGLNWQNAMAHQPRASPAIFEIGLHELSNHSSCLGLGFPDIIVAGGTDFGTNHWYKAFFGISVSL